MDINTIFYFPASLTFEDYTEMLENGEIAARTIVFADAQKSIYKDGKKYGDLSEQKFRDLVNRLLNDSWISDEIQGIRTSIASLDSSVEEEMQGVKRSITSANSELSRLSGLITSEIQNTQDYIDSVNAEINQLISDEIQSVHDDITSANESVANLSETVDEINNSLNDEITNRNSAILSKIEDLFEDTQWLTENFPQGQTDWDSNWNDELESYLTTIGYWDVDAQTGDKTTKWSKLQTSIDSVSQSVNDLKTNGNLTEAMESSIKSLISDDIATLNLSATYATINDANKQKNLIEWLYSGLKLSSEGDKTFAQLSSMQKSEFVSAISDIRTQVDKVANGDFVAQTEVSAKVGDTIANMLLLSSSDNSLAALSAKADANSDNISAIVLGLTGDNSTANLSTVIGNVKAGFASSSDINTAKNEIYSAIGAKDGNDNFISLSALKTQADADHATLTTIAENQGSTSGFVARSELGSAVAELFASTGNAQNPTAKANVVAVVKDNKSSLGLTANDVNIDGYLTAGNATFKGNVEATQFTTGTSNESGICVLSSAFDPASANTHKAYFAPDGEQGGITMWFYFGNAWKRLDLSACSVQEDPDAFWTYVYYTGIIGNALATSGTSVDAYLNKVTNKYYSTTSAVDANLLNVNVYKNTAGGYFNRFNTNPWADYYSNGTKSGDINYNITNKADGPQISYYITNVPSQLNLGQKPLYLMSPKLYEDAYSYAFSVQYMQIQNGLVASNTNVSLYWTCDTILWHAAGDPLPAGLVAQGSQTPSTSDAFAYAVWEVTDRTAYKKTMSNGSEFCLSGGDGKVYSTTAKGNQYVYKPANLSNYSQNTSRNHTSDSYLSSNTTNGVPQYGYLNTDAWVNTGAQNMKYDSSKMTEVAHIWHTFPQLSSYVSYYGS